MNDKEIKNCIRCTGEMMRSHILSGKELVAANTQDDSIFSLKLKSTKLTPYICTSCGYCEFYADDISELL